MSSEKLGKISNSPKSVSSTAHKNVNLMTPDSFSTSGQKTPECVSSEVLSTILMLASVTGSTTSSHKTTENINFLNLVNNKIIEDQEHQKYKQAMQKNCEVNANRINSEMLASGGSSPSREVQEILSLREYKGSKKYFSDNEKNVENINPNGLSENISDPDVPLTTENPFEGNATEQIPNLVNWPKVPDVRNVMKHSVELENSSNIVRTENTDLNELNLKMMQLMNMVQLQTKQLSDLKEEISELKKNKEPMGSANDFTFKIEAQLSKMFQEFSLRYESKLDSVLSSRSAQSRELRDTIIHALNQFLFKQFAEKMSEMLILEIQRQVVPVLVTKLDMIKQQIQLDVSQKLTTTDKILKENIAQVCKSKSIIDAFGNSVLMGVQNGLQATYVQSMSNTLIPAYEKSSQEMFKQLHDTFSIGIKEVMEQFDSYICQLQPVQDSTDEILDKINELQKVLEGLILKQRCSGNESILETRKEMKLLETNLTKSLTEILQREVRRSFESQAASLEDSVLSVVRSQAHTPAPSVYDVQDQIKNLLSQGHINKAFHQALLANDLSLVEYTLERADHTNVFNPCVLEQTVLLSLIQQISADMENHNDIKQKYLSDGIFNLNHNDPITKEHAPKVMRELYRKCQCFLSANPKSALCSNVRMIMMAVQGMGYKVFK